jgi:allophanate hydrolase
MFIEADVEPFLEAARLLYQGPWIAERWASFGHELADEVPGIDPVVRRVVRAGRDVTGEQTFRGLHRLAELRAATAPLWQRADALLLPVTPDHPTLDDVAADPIGVNTRLGTYTNFVNLLDLCAVAVPGPARPDGLPFGAQLIAPAFADEPLLRLAARWTGEAPGPKWTGVTGSVLLAVVGAHLTGQPLNRQLVAAGATLHARGRTGPGYRLYRLPGDGSASVERPALVPTHDGPDAGIELEVWTVPSHALGAIADTIPRPLGLGRVVLDDGADVLGFVLTGPLPAGATDVTEHGGWRAAVEA